MTEIVQSTLPAVDPMFLWLKRQLDTKRKGHKPIQIVVGHLNEHDASARMDQFDVDTHDEQTAKTLAKQIRYVAQADAEVRGGLQRYAVQMHWPGDSDPAYHAFSVDGASLQRAGDMLSATEPPTSAGLLKQHMRHTEVAVRVAMKGAVQMQEQYEALVSRLVDRVQTLETDRQKVIELGEQLMTQNLEREIQRNAAEHDEKRKQQGFDQMMAILEVGKAKVIEHVSGVKMLSSGDPGSALIREVMTGLDGDDLKRMMEPLPPEKRAMVLELYKAVHGLSETKTAAAAKPDGEEDTTDGA